MIASPSPSSVQELYPALKTSLNETLALMPKDRSVLVLSEGGDEIYGLSKNQAFAPASVMKVLTLLALSHSPLFSSTLKTSLRYTDRALYLVAGGDSLLSPDESNPQAVNGRAGVATLVAAACRELKTAQAPAGEYTLHLDVSLFSGASLNPGWEEGDIASGQICALYPLAFNSHRVPGGGESERPENAAQVVYDRVLALLNEQGKENGYSFKAAEVATAPENTQLLASVESAPVSEQAQLMMLSSDNALAEVLARCAARHAAGEGSAEAAQRWVRDELTRLAIPLTGLVQADVCGLAPADRLSAVTTAAVLRALLNHPDQKIAESMPSFFPLAGVSGTLVDRFESVESRGARSQVWAKTGTLYSAASLAGWAVTPEGQRRVFVIFCNFPADYDTLVTVRGLEDQCAALIAGRAPNSIKEPAIEPSVTASESADPSALGTSVPPS